MITKRRINEDFDQRLTYLMKQYGKGWLICNSGFLTILTEDSDEIFEDTWENMNEKIAYITTDKRGISKEQERVYKPKSNDIADKIINMVYKDINTTLIQNVPLRFIAKEILIIGDCINISIPVHIHFYDNYEDEAEPEFNYYDDIVFAMDGDYTMNISYMFKLNDKLVRGDLLSLLTDFELVR